MQAKGDSESRPCASDILTIGLVQNIGRVSRQDVLIRKIHGTDLAQAEEQVSKC
jgi:hypothetical protein